MIFTTISHRHQLFVPRIPRFFALFLVTLVGLGVGSNARAQVRSLSLDDAISIALDRGEEVSLAKAGVRSAEGGLEVATSGMLPQIAATANYTRLLHSQYGSASTANTDTSAISKALSSLFKNFPFGKENSWTLGLSASQTIFTGGRLTAQREAAQARKHSADIDLTAAQAQLVLNVTQSYYDAVLADTLLRIARDVLAQAEEVDRQTELQYQVGEKAEFDALRTRVARDNQVPLVLQSENDRAQAYYRLKQLLNISLDDSLVLTTPVADSLARFAMSSDSATESRASVEQARLNVAASQAQIRVAESAHWPQISIVSQYSPVAYPDNFIPKFSDWLTNWTAGVNLSLPIYLGGSISGNVDIAKATADQARDRLEQAREAAQMDARVAFDNLHSAEANLRATTSTSAQAQRAYEIARVRFGEGISTEVELDDARLQEEQARANAARALRNYQVARAKLALLKDLPVSPVQAPVMPMGAQSAVTQQSAASQQSMTAPASFSASPSGATGQ